MITEKTKVGRWGGWGGGEKYKAQFVYKKTTDNATIMYCATIIALYLHSVWFVTKQPCLSEHQTLYSQDYTTYLP